MAVKKTTTKKTEVKAKQRKVLTGLVVKVSSDRTASVQIESKFPHPKYGKIIKTHKKYLVDKKSDLELNIGDQVSIGEIRPISKRKSWEVIEKLN